jgi:ribonuclease VapC
MSIKPEIILDASAIIAYLDEEPGSEVVEKWFAKSAASLVNVSEVIAVFVRQGYSGLEVAKELQGLIPLIVPFDWEIACLTATLISKTHTKGLSLGDRAALATALRMKTPVLTAESRWLDVSVGVDVHLIRPKRK